MIALVIFGLFIWTLVDGLGGTEYDNRYRGIGNYPSPPPR
jgi:hypothetical protein